MATEGAKYLDRVSEHWAIDEERDAWQQFYCGKGHKFTCELCERLVETPTLWMSLKGRVIRCSKHLSNE